SSGSRRLIRGWRRRSRAIQPESRRSNKSKGGNFFSLRGRAIFCLISPWIGYPISYRRDATTPTKACTLEEMTTAPATQTKSNLTTTVLKTKTNTATVLRPGECRGGCR
ncbi:unnamed protein product, partial [Ectocarpus sp. 12 AP-2014]